MTRMPSIFLPLPRSDLGIPDGISPAEALESVLRHALEVARAERAVLVVPPDHMCAFVPVAESDVEHVELGDGAEVVCRGPVALELDAIAARSTPSFDPEKSRLLLPTAVGGLALFGVALPEDEAPARIALLQGLASFASASAAYAGQLVDAERRAASAEAEQWALREDCARLRELANVDDLTGLYNRRFFDRQLAQEMQRFRRYRHPVALALIDVDHFKHVNDTHGHAVGDAALRLVAEVARRTMRKADFVARIGGDELAVLMPDTPEVGALIAAERLRSAVGKAPLPVSGGMVTVTLSVGVAGAEGEVDADAEKLVEAADHALYRAKEGGRDRVEAAAIAEVDPVEPQKRHTRVPSEAPRSEGGAGA